LLPLSDTLPQTIRPDEIRLRHFDIRRNSGGNSLVYNCLWKHTRKDSVPMKITGPIKSKVSNRGVPPDDFLKELIAWGRTADDEIFEVRRDDPGEVDVYTHVRPILGPWSSMRHRRAAMLEVLRVLAGFESSWDWNCGRDVTNATSITPLTIEAGAFQVSANSRAFGRELRDLAPADGDQFQRAMKADHSLAMEYAARLLRHTIRHNGPVKRSEINPWLRRDAVLQFMDALA
jgi:hypothetical protein